VEYHSQIKFVDSKGACVVVCFVCDGCFEFWSFGILNGRKKAGQSINKVASTA